MFSEIDNEWDLANVAQMTFYKVEFDVYEPQITATVYFRKAWKFLPPTPDTINVESDFIKKYANYTDEEWA